jgi:branched-chain amino acid transport system permease protein
LAADRLRLTGVVTAAGPLSEIQVFMLRQYWLGHYEGQARASRERHAARTPLRQLLYALQLAVDGIALAAVYGLLAIGYSLVYAVVGRINLAFGELAMVGAYTTFLGVTALALAGLGPLPLVLLGLLLVTAGVGAVHGLVVERMIFRPLRGLPSQAPLIATVGLAILLQEYLRLTQGAGDRWVQPVFSDSHQLAAGGGFEVVISTVQLLVITIGGIGYGALAWMMKKTRFGRNIRAIADDGAMAALCGVDVGRTVTLTFMLGSAAAAVAGLVVLLRYGGVSFADGLLLGFKALTAAIIGGLGRVEGAMLGGLVIAMVEVFWAGYLSLAYRDVAVFGLLTLCLICRPQGLLGGPALGPGSGFQPRPV